MIDNDTKFNVIFVTAPSAAYTLLGLPDPGPATARSVEFKAVQTRADLIIEPEDQAEPALLIEFQGYRQKQFVPIVMSRCAQYLKENYQRPFRCHIRFIRFMRIFAPKGPKQISPGQSATAKPCSVALGNECRRRSALKGRNTEDSLCVSPLQG